MAATLLPWKPPTLNKPRTVHVTDDPATRRIKLKAGEDLLLVLPDTPLSDYQGVGLGDSLVTVTGGRHVIVRGGWIHALPSPICRLTKAIGPDDTTIPVDTTRMYPPTGTLRLDGEAITYASLDHTHFLGCTRRSGYFNDSPASSKTTHAKGALVYAGERNRGALSFQRQTGTIHVEGLRADGFLCDGIRVSGGTAILQVQNSHLGPVTNHDLANQTDGHPDVIQAYGGGAREVRLGRVTLHAGRNGNCIINKGSDSGPGTPVKQWRLRDVELVSVDGQARCLIANSDQASAWDVQNGVLRYDPTLRGIVPDKALAAKFKTVPYVVGQPDLVPAESVGVGYVSPGYTA